MNKLINVLPLLLNGRQLHMLINSINKWMLGKRMDLQYIEIAGDNRNTLFWLLDIRGKLCMGLHDTFASSYSWNAIPRGVT